VPRVIRAFREAYPLLSITLEEWSSNELVEHLRNERIDAAFIRTPPADAKGLVISTLLEEELVVALPEGHVLAQGDGRGDAVLPLKALAGETLLVWGGQHGLGSWASAIAACHAAGFNPRLGQEAPRLASTLNLVAVGLGFSIVTASLQRIQMDGLVYRRLKSPTRLKVPLMLASRRGDPSVAVRHYVDVVKRAAKDFSVDDSEYEVRRGRKRKSFAPLAQARPR
jgi:DNA-binding transcriptional LysR family regulator